MDRVFDTLQRIRQLWKELERTRPDTAEYKALMEKIRVRSAGYQALIEELTDAPKKPRESK
jgi:hypothetical protein